MRLSPEPPVYGKGGVSREKELLRLKKCSRTSSHSDSRSQVGSAGNVLTRQAERNDRVFRAIIGPEYFAVESQ
jgi:hypothetical protein